MPCLFPSNFRIFTHFILGWCSELYGPVVGPRLNDFVDFPGEIEVIRENGYDADGEMVLRIEVRTLISYTRLLTDNNNVPTHLDTPGFRYRDLSNNVITMMQMYHENRNSSPCKL